MLVDGDYLITYLFFRRIGGDRDVNRDVNRDVKMLEVTQDFWIEICKLIAKFDKEKVAIAWDWVTKGCKEKNGTEKKGKRRQIYSEYKKVRSRVENPQMEVWYKVKPEVKEEVKKGSKYFPVIMGELERLEADDLLWVWKNAEGVEKCTIISGDKDVWQCCDRMKVEVFSPRSKEKITFGEIQERFGGSKGLVLQRCLEGDLSDGIKGVSMIGERRSKEIWDKYGEGLVELIEKKLEVSGRVEDKWLAKVLLEMDVVRRNWTLMRLGELISAEEKLYGESLLKKETKFDVGCARKFCAIEGYHLIFQRWDLIKSAFLKIS